MKMTDIQYAAEPSLNPGLPLHGPTLGTASATTAVIADAREPARTRVFMPTQSCCSAVQNGIYSLILVLVQRMFSSEALK